MVGFQEVVAKRKKMKAINAIRKKIDKIDVSLLKLFLKRYKLVETVGKIKNLKHSKQSIISGKRENEMLLQLISLFEKKVKPFKFQQQEHLKYNIFLLFRQIISCGISLEQNSEILCLNTNENINGVAKCFGGFFHIHTFTNIESLIKYHQNLNANSIIASGFEINSSNVKLWEEIFKLAESGQNYPKIFLEHEGVIFLSLVDNLKEGKDIFIEYSRGEITFSFEKSEKGYFLGKI